MRLARSQLQPNKITNLLSVAALQNVNRQSFVLSLENWKARQLQQQGRLASSIHCPQPCILIFHTIQQSISLNIIIPADICSQVTCGGQNSQPKGCRLKRPDKQQDNCSIDIGITTDTTSNISSTCVVLALVAGHRDCQPRPNSQ